jgi:hypothetical protein
MSKDKDAKLKAIVFTEYEKNPNISAEELSEIIKPHIEYDTKDLINRELKRQVRRIISSIKDDDGVRVYFSNGRGNFVNVDTTTNMDELQKVELQIYKKLVGTTKSYKKVLRRKQVLFGQLSIFDNEVN